MAQAIYSETAGNLLQAFSIRDGEVISLVGGGGKTTLMFALARELAAGGKTVVTTTTTKIMEPSPEETPRLIVEADEDTLMASVLRAVETCRHVTVARARLPGSKLDGIAPGTVIRLGRTGRISCVIVEADGAAQRPLKAPRATEPVIPANTSLVIPVVGVEAIGCRLTENCVFRAEIASRLLGLPLGQTVTAAHIATLIVHPQGLTKGSPAAARIIPFLNKADLDPDLSRSRDLAWQVLARGAGVERVVIGSAQSPGQPFTIVQRSR